MDHQTFSDGIGRIAVIDGIVRLDLVAYSPETDAKGHARPVFTHRVVMGMDAFLRAADKMAETVKLIKQAAERAPQQQETPQVAAPAAPAERPRPWERPQEVPPQFRRESVRAEAQYPAHPPPAAAVKRPFP